MRKTLLITVKKVLKSIPANCIPVVLLGRPYNSADPYLNLNLTSKLISQNVMPIPVDMIDLSEFNILKDYRNMYWPNGQKIIAAAQYVAKNSNLYAVYISNFRCGPRFIYLALYNRRAQGKTISSS